MTTASGQTASSTVGARVFVDAMLAHTAGINAEIERATAGLAGTGTR